MLLRAEQVCAYDLDDVDQRWLINVNGERALMGLSSVTENEMERVMEELERQCRDKINTSLRSSEDTEIQQDESIICDVCRSVSSPLLILVVFRIQKNIILPKNYFKKSYICIKLIKQVMFHIVQESYFNSRGKLE